MFSGNGSASASSMCTTIERQTSEHRPVPAVLPSRRAVRDFDCCLRMCRVHIYIRCARTQVPPSLSAMLHPRPAKAIGWRRAGIEIACFQLSQPLLPEVKSKQRTLGSRNWREGRNESARNETAGRTGRMYRVEANGRPPPPPRPGRRTSKYHRHAATSNRAKGSLQRAAIARTADGIPG